jgi:hypothetical protein
MALTTKTIVNDGQFLVVTSSLGTVESINLGSIKNITYTDVSPAPGTYPYTDLLLLTVEITSREADLSFVLASVTNQAGWTLNEAGCIQAEADIRGWAASSGGGGGGGGDATEATQLLVKAAVESSAPFATVLVSSSTTGAATIPALSKAATIVIDGSGGQINGVIRPDGWSQSFEFNNDTLPAIPYNGNGTATMYVDILT